MDHFRSHSGAFGSIPADLMIGIVRTYKRQGNDGRRRTDPSQLPGLDEIAQLMGMADYGHRRRAVGDRIHSQKAKARSEC